MFDWWSHFKEDFWTLNQQSLFIEHWLFWLIFALVLIGLSKTIIAWDTKRQLIKRAEAAPSITNLPRGALGRRYQRVKKRTQADLKELADLCDEVLKRGELSVELSEEAGDISLWIFNIRSSGGEEK